MTAWYITRKDLLLLVKDKRAVVLLLVLPLLFISIVGMSTGQFLTRDENNQRFKITVVDQDGSELSQRLLDVLERHRELLVVRLSSLDEARLALKRGEASLLLTIGSQFEERADELRISDVLNSDSGPLADGPAALDLTLESRPASIGLGRLLEGVIFSQVVKVVAPVAARKNAVARTWLRDRSNDELNPNASTAGSDAAHPDNKPRTGAVYLWIVPGFTVMFAFFLISVMARSFIAERDNGTLKRLLLAPIGTSSVLIGKTVPYFLTSVVQCSLLFLCGRLLFGMSWGPDPMYLVPVILCTSLAATSLGLLLATMVHTDQQVSSYGTTLILVLSSVSGCFFPREMFPPLMKRISLFTPHGWALRAFDGVLTQTTVDVTLVTNCCAMLVLFATIFFVLGWWRFRATH
ncbi:MAG: ABC transporter permease [Planctomycetota bacterium]